MPDKDGIETIMEFQRHSPRVRIIAISGGGKIQGNEYLSITKMLGAEKTLPKPFELREMLEAVRELLPI
jgi:DNA-binding response OmpR family regulator